MSETTCAALAVALLHRDVAYREYLDAFGPCDPRDATHGSSSEHGARLRAASDALDDARRVVRDLERALVADHGWKVDYE